MTDTYKDLKPVEVLLFNKALNMAFKMPNLFEACKNAVKHNRFPSNGWNIIDHFGNTYEDEDWEFIGSFALLGIKL